jgi:hypothetical protein
LLEHFGVFDSFDPTLCWPLFALGVVLWIVQFVFTVMFFEKYINGIPFPLFLLLLLVMWLSQLLSVLMSYRYWEYLIFYSDFNIGMLSDEFSSSVLSSQDLAAAASSMHLESSRSNSSRLASVDQGNQL